MTLLIGMTVIGASCDVRSCDVEHRLREPADYHSVEHRRFLALLLCDGWAQRIGRSVTWFCPAHADRAGQHIPGRWGQCSPWCPVHKDGQVRTWATEDAKRLAGQRNMLSEADR